MCSMPHGGGGGRLKGNGLEVSTMCSTETHFVIMHGCLPPFQRVLCNSSGFLPNESEILLDVTRDKSIQGRLSTQKFFEVCSRRTHNRYINVSLARVTALEASCIVNDSSTLQWRRVPRGLHACVCVLMINLHRLLLACIAAMSFDAVLRHVTYL